MIWAIPIISQIELVLEQSLGGLWLVGLAIMAFLAFVLMIVGVDFRFTIMLIMPLILVFSSVGWFPFWLGGLVWVVVVGIGLYIVWNMVRDR